MNQLIKLIESIPCAYEIKGSIEGIAVSSLCIDSRAVKKDSLFFCIPGLRMDGHDFAPQAVSAGACALIVGHELPLDIPQIIVSDVRIAAAHIAAAYYDHPSDRMTVIGITGTKGKTTTSYLIKSVMEAAGHKVGLIGTVGSMIGDEAIPTKLTTPDALEMQYLLRRMADAGVTCVVMEVSAHAVSLHRVDGIRFTVGGFSNLSQDHLDFYGTMEKYLQAKLRFMEKDFTEKIVYNADDETVGPRMAAFGREALRVGIAEPSDLYAKDIEIGEYGCSFKMVLHKKWESEINLHIAGIFNVYNALLAAGLCLQAGVAYDSVKAGLEKLRAVPGRIELLETGTPYRVILDYAHSPDALENILKAVRQTTKGRMICLFGCGGNRDKLKRPIMGEIGGRLADYCILTSDNPRNEDPMAILDAIEEGIKPTGCEYIVIENRREAIRYALRFAKPNDVVILAGKGHETYQEINGVRNPFDEKIVVAELLKDL